MQFADSCDAAEAQRRINGKIFAGREISVVVAAETRKRPEEMRHRSRQRYSLSLSHTQTQHMHTQFPDILLAYIYIEIYMACNSPEGHQAMGDGRLIMVCYS